MTYEKTSLFAKRPSTSICILCTTICTNICSMWKIPPINPWISVNSITTPMLIMFTHALTLFVLILRFCIVYWFVLKFYELYLIIVNCSLLQLVIYKGFPCSQLILIWCVELWHICCYPCHCEVWDSLSTGVLQFILRRVCV